MFSEKFPEKVKVGSVGGKFPKRNGQPYIISKGVKKEGFWGVALMQAKAKGKS
jgi:hypothetical protein